jgi:hypothetical protein
MKTISIFVAMILSGCGPRFRDSSALVITPGLGISNVIEIGMSPREVDHRTRDLQLSRLEYVGTYSANVPSLGAQWPQATATGSLYTIDFLVKSDAWPSTTFTNGLIPFCGAVDGGLSFAGNKSVIRSEVVGVFGEPDQHIDISTNTPDQYPEVLRNMMYLRSEARSTSIRTMLDTELLSYPDQGIGFALHKGAVYVIGVKIGSNQGLVRTGDLRTTRQSAQP